MFRGLRDLLLHPDAFFQRIGGERVNLLPPLLIVGTALAINILVLFLVMSGFSRSGYSAGILSYGGLQRDIFLVFAIRAGIMTFGVWIFITLVAFGLSRLLSGKGSFSATLQNMGYGMIPLTLSMLIPVILFVYRFLLGVPYGMFSGTWLTDPSSCIIIALIVTIWSSYLWVFAIRHTQGLSPGLAAGIIIISIALWFGTCMALSPLLKGVKIGFISVF